MEEALQAVVRIFYQAVPTAILVFLLYVFLRFVFFGPLTRVLEERERRTTGARRDAQENLTSAEQKARTYQEKLRHARAEIYRQQEVARREALEERNRLVRDTRQQANEMVRAAKTDLLRDLDAAKARLEQEGSVLAAQITRVLLEPR